MFNSCHVWRTSAHPEDEHVPQWTMVVVIISHNVFYACLMVEVVTGGGGGGRGSIHIYIYIYIFIYVCIYIYVHTQIPFFPTY